MSTLIVERHAWETGAGRQQIQIPRDAFTGFFPGTGRIDVDVYASPWLRNPTRRINAQLSYYSQSSTYRLNRIYEIANIGAAFIAIQKEDQAGVVTYALWWELDLALVAAKFDGWEKARDSQHGRGRVWAIVDAQVDRPVGW